MYRNFYGFSKYPFCNTPDTEFFFNSEKHTEALAHLTYVITERKGFAVITGDVGAGKTIVSRELLNRIHSNLEVGLLTNTCLKEDDFLKAICEEFNLPTQDIPNGQLLSSLNDFFIRCLSQNKNVVLIVDEAQNLSPDTLEKIRMLSNLETEREKLIQIILLGQPELRDILSQPRFEQLRQRISLWYHLRPLNFTETRDYIDHRLAVVGSSSKIIFSTSAIQSLFQYSKGVPRIINTLCDNSLLIGYIRGTKQIHTDIVEEVVKDLGMAAEEVRMPETPAEPADAAVAKEKKRAVIPWPIWPSVRWTSIAAGAAGLIVLAGLVLLFTGKGQPQRVERQESRGSDAQVASQPLARLREDYRKILYENFKTVWNQVERKALSDLNEMAMQQEVLPGISFPGSSPQTTLSANNGTALDLIPTESEL